MLLSFCIISIGQKSEQTRLCIQSIHNNFDNKNDYEIVLVGNNISQFSDCNVKLIEDNQFIEFLGKRKNIAIENSCGDILIHCDDDILFPPDWFFNFKNFLKTQNNWEIMSNRILLPDGNRYWDRCTYFPYHVMTDYDFYSKDVTFYQGGCFSVCKRSLFDKIKWDENLPYYASIKGFKYNEDIEFSIRLKHQNIDIFFDKNNTVWHYDFSYASNNITCNKHYQEKYIEYKCLDFIKLLNNLSK
jgi:GT2 family glycosyltransferase